MNTPPTAIKPTLLDVSTKSGEVQSPLSDSTVENLRGGVHGLILPFEPNDLNTMCAASNSSPSTGLAFGMERSSQNGVVTTHMHGLGSPIVQKSTTVKMLDGTTLEVTVQFFPEHGVLSVFHRESTGRDHEKVLELRGFACGLGSQLIYEEIISWHTDTDHKSAHYVQWKGRWYDVLSDD